MDALELNVDEAGFYEQRDTGRIGVDELLQIAQTRHKLLNRRWHINRVAWARTADPVLRRAEFAGGLGAATAALHETAVHFTDQPQGNRQVFHALDAIHHRIDVIGDLSDVVYRCPGFGIQALQAVACAMGLTPDVCAAVRMRFNVRFRFNRSTPDNCLANTLTAWRPATGTPVLSARLPSHNCSRACAPHFAAGVQWP